MGRSLTVGLPFPRYSGFRILGALKGFADGFLGSTTALFEQPYDDAPRTSGLPNEMVPPEGNMLKMALEEAIQAYTMGSA